MARRFNWSEDCGTLVSPTDAALAAYADGLTYEQFAEGYADCWPFADEGPPPADLVDGMAQAMYAAAPMDCSYCGASDLPPQVEVPAVDDEAAWVAAARDHASTCEWVATRAHRMEAS